jgi:rubrerythrin
VTAVAAIDLRAATARAHLVFLLQLAYSGELGAARAYAGHAHSLRDSAERAELRKICRDEIRHRRCLRRMLAALGAAPELRREAKMDLVGRSIAVFCHVGGWFFPMYGAGRLESQNIREYEHAARLAAVAGCDELIEELLVMAEVEWDHERFFREKASSHPLWRVVPHWRVPGPRSSIRDSFAAYLAGDRPIEPVVAPWLVR